MGKTFAVATVMVALLCCSPVNAGFTNNSGNPTSVIDLGTSEGTFRINSLTDSGQLKTTANSVIDPASADSYSEVFSGEFNAYWVRTRDYTCGIDFDVVFDAPILGIVATNAFRLNGIGPVGVDLMAAFTSATGIPSFGGNTNLGLEILPFNPQNPDTLTVDGNRVFGMVHSPPENFMVLTGISGSGSGVVGVPEPATMTVWGLLGLVSSGAGYRRLRRKSAT